MTESANAQTTRRIVQAVTDFDFDLVESLVTDDVVIDVPFPALGMPPRSEGREGFVAGLRFVPTMFRSFRLTITALYDCPLDDVVIFEQESDGVFAHDGGSYANRYMMLFGFRDGKVSLWREYYNSRIMTDDMGPVLAKMTV